MAKTRVKPKRSADTSSKSPLRERVLNAAFSTFMEKGYAAASTLEIATRAKVSKRELYQICADKPALLRHAIAERAQRMRLPLDLPPATNRTALAAALKALGIATLGVLGDPAVRAVHRLVISESVHAPDLAQALDAGRVARGAALAQTLARAQADRLLGKGDTAAMAADFFALLIGDLMIRMLLRVADPLSPAAIERRARDVTEKFLRLYS
jgi:AcrR family transcriptional regulator